MFVLGVALVMAGAGAFVMAGAGALVSIGGVVVLANSFLLQPASSNSPSTDAIMFSIFILLLLLFALFWNPREYCAV